MNKALAAGALVTTLFMGCAGAAWANDVTSQPQLQKLQADAVPALQRAVADATGHKLAAIVAKVSSHVVTITVVNSKLNAAGSLERKNNASVISSAVAGVIADKIEFADIMMIHVDFVERQGKRDDVIQGLDFNKDPAGGFSPHIT